MAALSTAVASGRKKRGEGHTRREEILLAAKELDRKKHPEWDAEAARRQGAMKPGPAPRKSLY